MGRGGLATFEGRAQAFMCGRPNKLPHTLEIPEHLRIRNAQYEIAFPGEPGITSGVVFHPRLEIVSFAINFNDETRGVTNEIDDVDAHGDLATKAETVEVMGLEISPEEPFGPRHRLAKAFGALALLVAYEIPRQLPPP
jgi:hypothetical protein